MHIYHYLQWYVHIVLNDDFEIEVKLIITSKDEMYVYVLFKFLYQAN